MPSPNDAVVAPSCRTTPPRKRVPVTARSFRSSLKSATVTVVAAFTLPWGSVDRTFGV